MSVDGAFDRRQQPPSIATANGTTNGVTIPTSAVMTSSTIRLKTSPNTEHRPESYDDLPLEFSPMLFSCLERYLPPPILNAPRDSKVDVMRKILLKYSPEGERSRFSTLKLADLLWILIMGFVVEYGMDKDVDLGSHVDDAEVTLNVCLGKEFSGGEYSFEVSHVRTMSMQKHRLRKFLIIPMFLDVLFFIVVAIVMVLELLQMG